jgi:hypothetical protein
MDKADLDKAVEMQSAWGAKWDESSRRVLEETVRGWGDTVALLTGQNLDKVIAAEEGKAAAELAAAIMDKQGSAEALWAGFR